MTTPPSSSLSIRRDYLTLHRRLAVGRALAGAAAGLLPVPFVDDWLIEAVLGGAFRRIAADHHVDLDAHAVKNLVHGRSRAQSWLDLSASAVAGRIATRGWQRALIALTAVRRARAASRIFATLTLFDHYCARVHTGLGLDGPRALALMDTIRQAIAETPGGLSFEPFRRGALAGARSVARAPLELADRASGGRLRRLLGKGGTDVAQAEAVDELDAIVEKELQAKDGVLARAAAAVELQLSAEVNPFLDQALERFDELWRVRGQAP
jgi:hypothetical protein